MADEDKRIIADDEIISLSIEFFDQSRLGSVLYKIIVVHKYKLYDLFRILCCLWSDRKVENQTFTIYNIIYIIFFSLNS